MTTETKTETATFPGWRAMVGTCAGAVYIDIEECQFRLREDYVPPRVTTSNHEDHYTLPTVAEFDAGHVLHPDDPCGSCDCVDGLIFARTRERMEAVLAQYIASERKRLHEPVEYLLVLAAQFAAIQPEHLKRRTIYVEKSVVK